MTEVAFFLRALSPIRELETEVDFFTGMGLELTEAPKEPTLEELVLTPVFSRLFIVVLMLASLGVRVCSLFGVVRVAFELEGEDEEEEEEEGTLVVVLDLSLSLGDVWDRAGLLSSDELERNGAPTKAAKFGVLSRMLNP
jgi:hypothetical protein